MMLMKIKKMYLIKKIIFKKMKIKKTFLKIFNIKKLKTIFLTIFKIMKIKMNFKMIFNMIMKKINKIRQLRWKVHKLRGFRKLFLF